MMDQAGKAPLNLSVCSIFKDESLNLPGLISCLPLTRIEWIAVDTGSRDDTVDLIRHSGVTPHFFTWTNDFSQARNVSLALAKRDWILWLDADDRVDEEFWNLVEPLLMGPKQAYRFIIHSPRENAHGDRFMQIRLFPNHLGIGFEGRIHEQLGTSLAKLGLQVKPTELRIQHIGYDTALKRQAKLVRNRQLLEEERRAFPHDPTVIMQYGNCLYQSAEYAEAKATFLSLLPFSQARNGQTAPSDEVLRHFPSLVGECCIKLHENEEARDWFELATRWNPMDTQPFYWLGKNALAEKDIPRALEFFNAAVDRPPSVGLVASDNFTVRRNALAMVVLCEIQLFGFKKAPRTYDCLLELINGGLDPFPLDYSVPWEFLSAQGYRQEAEHYMQEYLRLFPSDLAKWEDFLEWLVVAGRYAEILKIFTDKPNLELASGVLEAFRLKSLEAERHETGRIYSAYQIALRKFGTDPTLLIYFSDFINHNRLYAQCYNDLKAWPRPSEPLAEFLRQLETQNLGA